MQNTLPYVTQVAKAIVYGRFPMLTESQHQPSDSKHITAHMYDETGCILQKEPQRETPTLHILLHNDFDTLSIEMGSLSILLECGQS